MNDNSDPSDSPLFANLRDDEPAILAAVSAARESLPLFRAAFSAKQFGQAAYLVKTPFVDRSDIGQGSMVGTSKVVAENPSRPMAHLWLIVASTLDSLFFCSVGEAPKQLGLKKGDSFVVKEEIIEDWMIVHQGVAYGGFSLSILRERLSENDKRLFDEHTGIHEFKQELP